MVLHGALVLSLASFAFIPLLEVAHGCNKIPPPILTAIDKSDKLLLDSNIVKQIRQPLHQTITTCYEIMIQEAKMSQVFIEDQLDKVAQALLSPIEQRTKSLANQARLHEKLDCTPGSFAAFTDRAIDELKVMETEYVAGAYASFSSIIERHNNAAKQLYEDWVTMHERYHANQESLEIQKAYHLLKQVGVLLKPRSDPESYDSFVGGFGKDVSMAQVLDLLEKLVELLDRLEEARAEFNTLKNDTELNEDEMYKTSMKDAPEVVMAKKWKDKEMFLNDLIKNEILENEKYYQLYIPLRSSLEKRIGDYDKQLENYTEKSKKKFIKIRSSIEEEITELKERMEILKGCNHKKQEL